MTVNTTPISAGQALETLKALWTAQKEQGIKVSSMMWGRPGIGKTQVAEQLAAFMGAKLYDVRLTTIDTSDLRGLPYYNHDTKTTQWYRPEDLPNDETPAVLFLDELSSAPAHIQPTVYGLLQERRVGQHKIPDNVMIVAAGNGVTDGAVAYEMGTAIADRLIHLQVVASPEDWIKNYAVPNDVHPAVIAFIKTSPQYFETTEAAMKNDNLIACTPRSWDRVSQLMKTITNPVVRRIAVAGTIGDAVANDFFIVAEDLAATVQVTEMLKKPRAERMKMVPTNMFGLNAMVFGLVGAVNEETVERVAEVFADLADPKAFMATRSDADKALFARMPLKELATYGMETMMAKVVQSGKMIDIFINTKVYQDYSEERRRLGLE